MIIRLLSLLFLSRSGNAQVNQQFGEYRLVHIDPISKSFSITRTYSSRSTQIGAFGFGWCSDLDRKIFIKQKNRIAIVDCKKNSLSPFTVPISEEFKIKRIGYLVIKQKNPNRPWLIVENNKKYYFNKFGQLVESDGFSLRYEKNHITEIVSPNKKIWTIQYSKDTDQITSIGHTLTYKYNVLLLVRASNQKELNIKYKYDRYLNLIFWQNGSLFETMKYDSEWDRITEWTNFKTCTYTFSYPPNQHTTVTNSCKIEAPLQASDQSATSQ